MTVTLKEPLRRATLSDVLRRRAQRDRNRLAVVVIRHDGERVCRTYAELNEMANRMANFFKSLGVRSGDVVATMGSNGIDHIVAYYGALKLGAAFTSVNPTLTPREASFQLENAAPRVLIHDRASCELAIAATNGTSVRLLPVETTNDSIRTDSDLATALLASDPNEPTTVATESDLAMLVYTSGTESAPKGVRIPHRNFLIATSPAWITEGYVISGDRFLLLAPLYTMAGLGTVTNLINAGACIVMSVSQEVDDVLRVISTERVTNLSQTPTFYTKLVHENDLEHTDLQSLRQCHTYGGAIPKHVIEIFRERAPQAVWATYWGQTELSQLGSIGYYRTLNDIPHGDPRWIGKPVVQIEIKVIDDEGADSEVGELLCRSAAVMDGYHKAPKLTAAVICDGWLHTGDIVRIDEDSNLFFYDRKKDVIKTGGMNVSSLEVETVLLDHPDTAAVAVVGLPDDYWLEAVTAFVVPSGGQDDPPDAQTLIDYARGRLAPYKVPKQVIFVDSLPRDPQGKIVKRELRRAVT